MLRTRCYDQPPRVENRNASRWDRRAGAVVKRDAPAISGPRIPVRIHARGRSCIVIHRCPANEYPHLPPSERTQHGSGRVVLGHLCDYEVVSRGVCRVTAVGRLAVTAVAARSASATCIKIRRHASGSLRRGHVQVHPSAHRGAQVRRRWLRS